MKEEIFFAEEIEFGYPREKIGKNEIDEIEDFPGKEDFIEFYTIHNGLDFIRGARFFPESCYDISMYWTQYIGVALFLPIRVNDEGKGLNIDTMRYIIEEKYESFEDFVLFHIPFALDVADNPFWIDIQTQTVSIYEVCRRRKCRGTFRRGFFGKRKINFVDALNQP